MKFFKRTQQPMTRLAKRVETLRAEALEQIDHHGRDSRLGSYYSGIAAACTDMLLSIDDISQDKHFSMWMGK